VLHSMGVVHRDIKPENILWNNRLRRFLLCDFGLSTSITERIAQKTLTCYCGTPSFMSYEMENLKNLQYKGYVDLFYNDVYGLSKVINLTIESIDGDQLNPINNLPFKVYSSNEISVS
jgi:serine/threonine protein kinase